MNLETSSNLGLFCVRWTFYSWAKLRAELMTLNLADLEGERHYRTTVTTRYIWGTTKLLECGLDQDRRSFSKSSLRFESLQTCQALSHPIHHLRTTFDAS